jgi:hypothetical protein
MHGDFLIKAKKITCSGSQKVKGTQKTDKQALKELYRQESNRQMFFFPVLPYVYFYEWGQSQV